jgi:hypothetical protein
MRTTSRLLGLAALFLITTGQASTDGCAPAPETAPEQEPTTAAPSAPSGDAVQTAGGEARGAAEADDAPSDGPRGTFFMVDGYGNHHHRTFLPGGLIYSGVPAGGPEVFGAEQARAGDARELGSYTLQNETLVIDWGGGEGRETKTFARKGSHVVLDGYTYEALPRYPKGHRLDGRYTTRSYNSMGVAGGGSMAWGGSATVVFRTDGTFDHGRAGFATTNTTTAGTGVSSSGAEHAQGRYTIDGNTITFTFSDGTVQHALVHPWNGEESARNPESLNLNGRTYTREQ